MAELTSRDFLSFHKMITPAVAQIVFWVLETLNLAVGIYIMATGEKTTDLGEMTVSVEKGVTAQSVLTGLLVIIVGSILIRVFMEILVVVFRMYDSLRGIEAALAGGVASPALAGGSPASTPAASVPPAQEAMSPPPTEAASAPPSENATEALPEALAVSPPPPWEQPPEAELDASAEAAPSAGAKDLSTASAPTADTKKASPKPSTPGEKTPPKPAKKHE